MYPISSNIANALHYIDGCYRFKSQTVHLHCTYISMLVCFVLDFKNIYIVSMIRPAEKKDESADMSAMNEL